MTVDEEDLSILIWLAINKGLSDAVLAFPGGRGTADMVRQAQRAGVPVWEIAAWHAS